MFEFLRNLRKSEEEKRQEMLSAYLDDALAAAEKQRFEQLIASDEQLRASLQEQRQIKASLSRLPRVRAPRNFTLDPALYGAPVDSAADRLYPIMRVATAAVALLFVLVLVLDFVSLGGSQEIAQPLAEQLSSSRDALEAPAEEAPPVEAESETAMVDEGAVEVTRVVEAVEEAAEMAAEEIVAEEAMAEEPAAAEMVGEAADAAEAVAEEEAEVIVEAEATLPSPDEVRGGGGPEEETPLAMTAPPAEGDMVAAPESEVAVEADQPPQATAQARLPLVIGGADLTKEAAAQSTAAPEALAPAEDGQAVDEAVIEETAKTEPEISLSTNQILAVVLGVLLAVLIVVTLILRRRAF